MLDHVLLDIIAAVRRSFEAALLERQAVEERFQVDVFLGDMSWETSYSLPGEGSPPRVRADVSLDWPTWSQSAFRSWSIGEPPDELPELVVEVALRVQRLARAPAVGHFLAVLAEPGPTIASDTLERSGPTIEEIHERDDESPQWAVEVSYEGTWRLDEAALEHPSGLEATLAPVARWVASTLVRLGDLELSFLPPDDEEVGRS